MSPKVLSTMFQRKAFRIPEKFYEMVMNSLDMQMCPNAIRECACAPSLAMGHRACSRCC